MRISKYFNSILTLWIISSFQPYYQELYKFDPNNINEQEIKLSEIADDIRNIPLENKTPQLLSSQTRE